MNLQTKRLTLLLNSAEDILQQIEQMSAEDRAQVSPVWLARIQAAAESNPWTHGFAIMLREGGVPVGHAAFKGPPTDEGVVEIAHHSDRVAGGTGNTCFRERFPQMCETSAPSGADTADGHLQGLADCLVRWWRIEQQQTHETHGSAPCPDLDEGKIFTDCSPFRYLFCFHTAVI